MKKKNLSRLILLLLCVCEGSKAGKQGESQELCHHLLLWNNSLTLL